jgi:hypothetical protein
MKGAAPMLASQILRSSLRRWYVVLFGLLATAGLAYYAFSSNAPRYEIQGTAVLLPGETTVPDGGNGFLYLGGLNPALEVLLRSVNSDGTAEQILGPDAGDDDAASYSVERDLSASGPILVITANGATKTEARETLDAVLAVLPQRLEQLQVDVSVPEGSQMTVLGLAVDQEPEPLTNDRTRFILLVAVGGVAGTLLVAGLLDGLVLAAQRRRADRLAAASTEPGDEPADDPLGADGPPVDDEPGPHVPGPHVPGPHVPRREKRAKERAALDAGSGA